MQNGLSCCDTVPSTQPFSTNKIQETSYLIDVSTVDTITQHSKRAFSALKSLYSSRIIEARHTRKTRLKTTEVLN